MNKEKGQPFIPAMNDGEISPNPVKNIGLSGFTKIDKKRIEMLVADLRNENCNIGIRGFR